MSPALIAKKDGEVSEMIRKWKEWYMGTDVMRYRKALQRIRSLDPKNAGEAIEIAREVLG